MTRRLDEIGADDRDDVGGKAASLGAMTAAGLSVPPGFVVTAGTYREFLEAAGLVGELRSILDIDPESIDDLTDAADCAQSLILEADMPADTASAILEAYDDFDGSPPVAVRSSATAEDTPDASFAGQQESYLNVTRDELTAHVQACWASLWTPRAIYYRSRQGYTHADVDIAVVVQRMVDADKSGVLFTRHPSTGESRMVLEAAWGLGEAVVSGSVSPDTVIVDRNTGDLIDVNVATKRTMVERDPETGRTVEQPVPEDRREEPAVSEGEVADLVALGERIEAHFGTPQDVEWAIAGDHLFVLQSRPITTLGDDEAGAAVAPDTQVPDGGSAAVAAGDEHELVSGLGASPGTASGPARIVDSAEHIEVVDAGDVIVTEMTTPDMVPAMQRAAAIVTDEGGMTSHASIVSRELGVPAVVGTGSGSDIIADGQSVTVDGDRGAVIRGLRQPATTPESEGNSSPATLQPVTATTVKANVSIPETAGRAAETGADGVGLLRLEHMILSMGATPGRVVDERGEDAYVGELVDGIRTVAEAFAPRPIRVRTLDAPTDEFRQLDGGDDEPVEHNPMLGYRGIRRSLDDPELFTLELRAFRRLFDKGYDNVEIMFPLVADAEDVDRAYRWLREAGIDPVDRRIGVMIETPSSALRIEDIVERGIDFVSFGTNDLTQYTLAVDRNNERVEHRFDALHPSVLDLIGSTIETCREHGVETGICGEAGSDPEMVAFLVGAGVTSISVNVDAVAAVRRTVARAERTLVLDAVR